VSSSRANYSCWTLTGCLKAGNLGGGLLVNISSQQLCWEEVTLSLEEVALPWEGL